MIVLLATTQPHYVVSGQIKRLKTFRKKIRKRFLFYPNDKKDYKSQKDKKVEKGNRLLTHSQTLLLLLLFSSKKKKLEILS